MKATVEEEAVGVIGIALVGRRTPIVAVLSSAVERRTEAVTRSRKEDGVVVLLANHLVAFLAVICSPCPCAVVYKFLKLSLCGQTPRGTPIGPCGIIGGVAGYITITLSISLAVFSCICSLCRGLTPGKIAAVTFRTAGSYITSSPFYAQT